MDDSGEIAVPEDIGGASGGDESRCVDGGIDHHCATAVVKPVMNVSLGAPDWRSYMIVNLCGQQPNCP